MSKNVPCGYGPYWKNKKRKQQLQNCLHFWSNYEVKIAPVACVVYAKNTEEKWMRWYQNDVNVCIHQNSCIAKSH